MALLLPALPFILPVAAFSLAGFAAYYCYFAVLQRRRIGGGDDVVPTAKVAYDPGKVEVELGSVVAVERYTWEEIRGMTEGFSSRVIGRGGFSTVYLARLPLSAVGAVKVHQDSELLRYAFRRELEVLLRIRHENIVKLLGYSNGQEGGALVFEYVPGVTLHDSLHASRPPLRWPQRMSVALQLATALEYLHDGCDLQIVHNDVKPSNVLVNDDGLSCKLCDFGSATLGFSAAIAPTHDGRHARAMLGSPGYVDPCYVRTGVASKKSDAYSFGVVMLELLTGREAFCAETGRAVAAMAAEAAGGVEEWVDARLGGKYDAEEAAVMAAVARGCVAEQPSLRPTMAEVVRLMREKVSSAVHRGSDGGGEWRKT